MFPGEEPVTFANASEKLHELGVALGVDTRTQAMIRRQELIAQKQAADSAALGIRPRHGLNVPQ